MCVCVCSKLIKLYCELCTAQKSETKIKESSAQVEPNKKRINTHFSDNLSLMA